MLTCTFHLSLNYLVNDLLTQIAIFILSTLFSHNLHVSMLVFPTVKKLKNSHFFESFLRLVQKCNKHFRNSILTAGYIQYTHIVDTDLISKFYVTFLSLNLIIMYWTLLLLFNGCLIAIHIHRSGVRNVELFHLV